MEEKSGEGGTAKRCGKSARGRDRERRVVVKGVGKGDEGVGMVAKRRGD
jgi:hypothetical protein